MSIRKELAKIRNDKNSPFIVRKFKVFTWLLTIIVPLLMFSISIALLLVGVQNLMINNNLTNANSQEDAISFFKNISSIIGGISTYVGVILYAPLVFIVIRAVAFLLNIIRGWSDYKRSVVPVKSIFITRLIMQGSIIVFAILCAIGLALLIQYSLNIVSTFGTDLKIITDDTIKKLETATQEQIESIIQKFQTDFQALINNIQSSINSNEIQKLLPNITIYALGATAWTIVSIIYGITIKIMLSKARPKFGDENHATKETKIAKSKDEENKKEKYENKLSNDKSEDLGHDLDTEEDKTNNGNK